MIFCVTSAPFFLRASSQDGFQFVRASAKTLVARPRVSKLVRVPRKPFYVSTRSPRLGFLLRACQLKNLVELLRERGGCFVVDRYVFGLSTKHPVVSVNEFTQGWFSASARALQELLFRVANFLQPGIKVVLELIDRHCSIVLKVKDLRVALGIFSA